MALVAVLVHGNVLTLLLLPPPRLQTTPYKTPWRASPPPSHCLLACREESHILSPPPPPPLGSYAFPCIIGLVGRGSRAHLAREHSGLCKGLPSPSSLCRRQQQQHLQMQDVHMHTPPPPPVLCMCPGPGAVLRIHPLHCGPHPSQQKQEARPGSLQAAAKGSGQKGGSARLGSTQSRPSAQPYKANGSSQPIRFLPRLSQLSCERETGPEREKKEPQTPQKAEGRQKSTEQG